MRRALRYPGAFDDVRDDSGLSPGAGRDIGRYRRLQGSVDVEVRFSTRSVDLDSEPGPGIGLSRVTGVARCPSRVARGLALPLSVSLAQLEVNAVGEIGTYAIPEPDPEREGLRSVR